jgi:hypothetical protein
MLDENLLLPSFPKFIKVLLPLIILLKIRIIGYIYIYETYNTARFCFCP